MKRFESKEEENFYILITFLRFLTYNIIIIFLLVVSLFLMKGSQYMNHLSADSMQRAYYQEHSSEIDSYFSAESEKYSGGMFFLDVPSDGIDLSSSCFYNIKDIDGNIVSKPVNIKVDGRYYIPTTKSSFTLKSNKDIFQEIQPLKSFVVNAKDYFYYTSNIYSKSFESKDIGRYVQEVDKDVSLNQSIEMEKNYEKSTRYSGLNDFERIELKVAMGIICLEIPSIFYYFYTVVVSKLRKYKEN